MNWVFRGKINRVINPNCLDVTFDLGFGVKKRHKVLLTDFSAKSHEEQAAMSCMISLVGGHRVIVSVDKKEELYYGRFYLYNSLNIDGVYEVVSDRRLPCLNKVMQKMQDLEFDTDKLNRMLNKKTDKR